MDAQRKFDVRNCKTENTRRSRGLSLGTSLGGNGGPLRVVILKGDRDRNIAICKKICFDKVAVKVWRNVIDLKSSF